MFTEQERLDNMKEMHNEMVSLRDMYAELLKAIEDEV